jgi:putative Mg2+ transporter-C (MgtC) family protein
MLEVARLPLFAEILNLAVAVFCGAIIGSERQLRGRMAGLRTNALVALGAAGFVIFSQLVPQDASPSRVAAQVVSGIGFLGAGIIFREGGTVHGLNTAATLWCSAAVGVFAGLSALPHALVMTAFVVFVNLGLRPLVKWLKTFVQPQDLGTHHAYLELICAPADEADLRAMAIKAMPSGAVTGFERREVQAGMMLTLAASELSPSVMQQILHKLMPDARIQSVHWRGSEDT